MTREELIKEAYLQRYSVSKNKSLITERPNIEPMRPFRAKAPMQMLFVDSIGQVFEYYNQRYHYRFTVFSIPPENIQRPSA